MMVYNLWKFKLEKAQSINFKYSSISVSNQTCTLYQVNVSLAAASVRLKKTREEKDQFDDASNQMIMHLKAKVFKVQLFV